MPIREEFYINFVADRWVWWHVACRVELTCVLLILEIGLIFHLVFLVGHMLSSADRILTIAKPPPTDTIKESNGVGAL